MSWSRLAALVLHRPRRVLAASLLLLVPPALAVGSTRTTYDVLAELPRDADSVKGFEEIARSFSPGQVQPLIVVVQSRRELWDDETFEAIDDLTVNVGKLPHVVAVRSITRPLAGREPPPELLQGRLGDVAAFPKRMRQGATGLGRAIEGLRRIRGGLRTIRETLPAEAPSPGGLGEALAGIEAMRDGVAAIRDGLGRAGDGLEGLAGGVAEPAQDSLEAAWQDLRRSTVAKGDPVYEDLATRVGTALALVSGRCPDASGIAPPLVLGGETACEPGRPIRTGYEGLAPTLRTVADGLGSADAGLARIHDGLTQLAKGMRAMAGGALGDLEEGLRRLRAGTDRMIGGLNLIVPGLDRLRRGLTLGVSLAEESGLLPDPSGDTALTATLVEAVPELRRRLSPFVAGGGRATRLFVTLDRPPYEARALETTERIPEVAELSLARTPLEDAAVLVAGTSALFSDVRHLNETDFRKIVLAVVLGILLILAVLLRSLVAPIYLVLTVLLSFLATLGLATMLFQGLLGQTGIVWWVPPFLFVLLVALGADYNIFLTSRIREEAEGLESREAVGRGLAATGGVITSAGLILAGTFAAMLAAPMAGLVQIGFATSVGILLDTFVVRSLLVPSIAVLLGRHNWWPSARARRP